MKTKHVLLNAICEMYPGVFDMQDMIILEKKSLSDIKHLHERLKEEETYRCKCGTYVTMRKPDQSLERQMELAESPGNAITRYVLVSLLKRYDKTQSKKQLLKHKVERFSDLASYTFSVISMGYGDYCCWDGKFWTSKELVNEIKKLVGDTVICERRENIFMNQQQFKSRDLCALLEIFEVAVLKCLSKHRMHDILNKTQEEAWEFVNNAKTRCNKTAKISFHDDVSITHYNIEKGNRLTPIKTPDLSKESLSIMYQTDEHLHNAWRNTKQELLQKYNNTADPLNPMIVKQIETVILYTKKIARVLSYPDPTVMDPIVIIRS